MVRSNCYNGKDFERVISVENCACDKSDYQCDFGFKQDDNWSTGCIKDPKYHHDPYEPPARCPSGEFYNLTRGYVKIRGDTCTGGHEKIYEPQQVTFKAVPLQSQSSFKCLLGWRVFFGFVKDINFELLFNLILLGVCTLFSFFSLLWSFVVFYDLL